MFTTSSRCRFRTCWPIGRRSFLANGRALLREPLRCAENPAPESTLQAFPLAESKPLESTNVLAYLWARSRIASLADYNQLDREDERVKAVTNLGLTYNLLTAYTSFVAVDETVRNTSGHCAIGQAAFAAAGRG